MSTQSNEQPVSPWHPGERSMHERLGIAPQMEAHGQRVLRDHLPEQHRAFFPLLPFIVLGAVDDMGQPWASVLEGEPGFLHSPDPQHLDIGALPGRGDPVLPSIQIGQPLGLLGIELHTRRRNRLNGRIAALHEAGFAVEVAQSFGNCPKYIQQRTYAFADQPGTPYSGAVETLPALDEAAQASILAADTFFVASYYAGDAERPGQSVDVSHRGGKPGFVRVDGNVLSIPDFTGNRHFNTLGNLLVNPRAGLLFIDFQSGDLLQLTGSTDIVADGPELAAFQGVERIWRFSISRMVRRRRALALRWQLQSVSPHLLTTGSWEAP